MHHIFGVNYFVFCFIVLALVLFFTREIRDEGFFGTSPETLIQLDSSSVPSSCSSLPPPANTSMTNPPSTPLHRFIQDNLIESGMDKMSPDF